MSSDRLECNASNCIRLLRLESNIFKTVEAPKADLSVVASNGENTVAAFSRGKGDGCYVG